MTLPFYPATPDPGKTRARITALPPARLVRAPMTVNLPFQVRAVGLPEPVAEHRFHPTRRWRFDWAWPVQRVAMEVDGGTFAGGRHTRGAGYERDAEKLNEAVALGWRVFRVTPGMVEDGRAIAWLERVLGGKGG